MLTALRCHSRVTAPQRLILAQRENTFSFFEYSVQIAMCQTDHRALPTWEVVIMGLVDAIVDRSFRDTQSGRVVVFTGDRRRRGYLVRSVAEEKKIRSFLKMFYFAHLYILVFGTMFSQGLASSFSYGSFGRPAHHLLGSVSFFVGIYLLMVGLPYALLWRAYKQALTSFTAPADEVLLTASEASGRQWILPAVVGFALLILAAILVLAIRPTVP
jgi:hypothetical protein